MFFGVLGLYCAVLSLIPPLRSLLGPVTRFLDTVTVPVSVNLAHAVFLLLLAAASAARKKAAWWLVVTYLALLLAVDVLALLYVVEWTWIPNLVLCAPAAMSSSKCTSAWSRISETLPFSLVRRQ
ncbi:hypothetical protein [Streptomyces sp. H27-C3]|uniref:hypothetical protein n=1 Tax=Streptomyces sp. H27-C3 TaxID=3046305 RepID=UPI0024B8F483|nr:hypothetical protein [Streptomyces sp. H27-C3]MDJ0465316.1 hypothetical protein [Streptomyces sp. H27-C3]